MVPRSNNLIQFGLSEIYLCSFRINDSGHSLFFITLFRRYGSALTAMIYKSHLVLTIFIWKIISKDNNFCSLYCV